MVVDQQDDEASRMAVCIKQSSNVLNERSESKGLPMNFEYVVYILECADKSYYVGSTDDLTARLDRQNDFPHHFPLRLKLQRKRSKNIHLAQGLCALPLCMYCLYIEILVIHMPSHNAL